MVLNAAGPGASRLLAEAGFRVLPVPLLRAINLVLRRPLVRSMRWAGEARAIPVPGALARSGPGGDCL
jgi:hypothetical protein